jgi:hypothetical protein
MLRPRLLFSPCFDFSRLRNRRFMFAPSTGELILGSADVAKSSHAEEHGEVGARCVFDGFVRGWVCGLPSSTYPGGVIHFAPAFREDELREAPQEFERMMATLSMFREAGAASDTLLRGAGAAKWEILFGEAYPELFNRRGRRCGRR